MLRLVLQNGAISFRTRNYNKNRNNTTKRFLLSHYLGTSNVIIYNYLYITEIKSGNNQNDSEINSSFLQLTVTKDASIFLKYIPDGRFVQTKDCN